MLLYAPLTHATQKGKQKRFNLANQVHDARVQHNTHDIRDEIDLL